MSDRLLIKPACGGFGQTQPWLARRGIPFERFEGIAEAGALSPKRVKLSGQTQVIGRDGPILANFGLEELARF